MRNEVQCIEGLMEQIARQDFEGEIEVFVGDGRSDDDSVAVLGAAATRLGLDVTVVDNPLLLASAALNECIKRATGDLIVRMDCHARYPDDYVSACVRSSQETLADNVGGPTLVEGETVTERAVACALESPFGGIGWTRLSGETPIEHDTVYCGAFRPEAFRKAGLFSPQLATNEDSEFNFRLRRAGGRVVLDPRIRSWYTPRSTLRGVFVQYRRYGQHKVQVMRMYRRPTSGRSLAPLALCASIGGLAIASIWSPLCRWALVGELATYAVLALVFAALAVRARGESWRLYALVVAVFPIFHVSYAIGMLGGLVRPLTLERAPRLTTAEEVESHG